MNIIDIKREIAFSELLGTELPDDIKELIDFFKELTYRHEKKEEGLESWYDNNGEWTIQLWDKMWGYGRLNSNFFDSFEMKHSANNMSQLILGMIEIVTKKEIDKNLRITRNLFKYEFASYNI